MEIRKSSLADVRLLLWMLKAAVGLPAVILVAALILLTESGGLQQYPGGEAVPRTTISTTATFPHTHQIVTAADDTLLSTRRVVSSLTRSQLESGSVTSDVTHQGAAIEAAEGDAGNEHFHLLRGAERLLHYYYSTWKKTNNDINNKVTAETSRKKGTTESRQEDRASREQEQPLKAEDLMRCDEGQSIGRSDSAAEQETRSGGLERMHFWFLLRVNEQLSKARMHFYDSLWLATHTGRVIVLPHVGDSLMDARRGLPFCTYFDVHSVTKVSPWVTQDNLVAGYRRMAVPPRALLLLVGPYCPRESQLGISTPEILRPVDKALSRFQYRCFGKSELGSAVQLTGTGGKFAPPIRPQKKATSKKDWSREERELTGNKGGVMVAGAMKPASLVMLVKDSPYFAFHHRSQYRKMIRERSKEIAYAPHLLRAVDKMISTLGENFLAVQWRFERLLDESEHSQRLKPCAEGLLTSAQKYMAQHNLTWVFVASDIGGEGALLSGSMTVGHGKEALEAAVDARRAIEKQLQPVSWERMVSGWDTVDTGVKGILDKLLCTRAKVLLHPPLPCEGKISSFLSEVLTSRRYEDSFPWIADL